MIGIKHHCGSHALDFLHDSVHTNKPFLDHLFMHLLQFIVTAAEWVREYDASWVVVSVPTVIIFIRVGQDELIEGSRRGILLFILVKDRPDRMLGLLLL